MRRQKNDAFDMNIIEEGSTEKELNDKNKTQMENQHEKQYMR